MSETDIFIRSVHRAWSFYTRFLEMVDCARHAIFINSSWLMIKICMRFEIQLLMFIYWEYELIAIFRDLIPTGVGVYFCSFPLLPSTSFRSEWLSLLLFILCAFIHSFHSATCIWPLQYSSSQRGESEDFTERNELSIIPTLVCLASRQDIKIQSIFSHFPVRHI